MALNVRNEKAIIAEQDLVEYFGPRIKPGTSDKAASKARRLPMMLKISLNRQRASVGDPRGTVEA